jgi:GMC oxidoreductase
MNSREFKLVILGAGPSGLTIAANSLQQGIRTLIIDSRDLSLQRLFSKTILPRENVRSAIGGNCRYWGGQIAYMTHEDLLFFQREAGLDDQCLQDIKKEMRLLANELSIPFSASNTYENYFVEQKYLNTNLVYSTYVDDLDVSKLLHLQNSSSSGMLEILQGEISSLIIEGDSCTGIQLNDGSVISLGATTAVCIALGTVQSTALLKKVPGLVKLKEPPRIVDHPHGYVAAFTLKKGIAFYKQPLIYCQGRKFKRKFLLETHREGKVISTIFELHYDFMGNFFPDRIRISLSLIESVIQYLNRLTLKLFRKCFFSPKIYWAWLQTEQYADETFEKSRNLRTQESSEPLSSVDLEIIYSTKARFIEAMESYGFQLIWEIQDKNIISEFSDAFHPSGSLKMSTKLDNTSILPIGKVQEVDNLFISSAATWPIAGWINPTFMLMVFARLVQREISRFIAEKSS